MKRNNKLYIATIFNHIQRLHILNWKGITYHIWQQYTNNIKQYLKMNSFINLLLVGQTPCPLFLLLAQYSNTTFCPLSSYSSPKQQQPQHSNTTKTFCPLLLLLPQHSDSNTTKMQPSVFFPKPRKRSLSLSDYWTTIC